MFDRDNGLAYRADVLGESPWINSESKTPIYIKGKSVSLTANSISATRCVLQYPQL